MMIATRFRTVGTVACVAGAALSCYLVSLKVAAERANVTRTERSLLAARQDIRSLQTELNTRSRLVQLERWNADVLALTAPKARQYLTGEMQLASLATTPGQTPAATSATPDASGLEAPAAVAQVAYHPAPVDQPATRLVHSVSLDLDTPDQPVLHRASLTQPMVKALGRLRQVAYLDMGGKTPRP